MSLQDALAFFQSQLFHDVQMAALFPDSKTFADAIGKRPLADICARYEQEVKTHNFDLNAFVDRHFEIPELPDLSTAEHLHVDHYVQVMWQVLQRTPDQPNWDSLIPLEHNYLVPGGRFREIYYWDSYFTALGLCSAGYQHHAVSMLENFLALQKHVGCIPNGNRAYYHSRSQPPVLVLLYDLLREDLAADQNARAIQGLENEYQFWMRHRSVRLPDGSVLNRYYDTDATPRPESYKEDVQATAHLGPQQRNDFMRHIRAACESGWDFSSRWLRDANDFSSLCTTDIVPVDLNALLYHLELRLSELSQDVMQRQQFADAAERRKLAIQKHLYCDERGFYFDYNMRISQQTKVWSLAGVTPLFVGLAEPEQATAVAQQLETQFLRVGGLVTTLTETEQQWDAPNGWAPLQWFAVRGLQHYGHNQLARQIMNRWNDLVQRYFRDHRVVLEKYDVCNPANRASGGEYEVQLGFGWTNGVYRAFLDELSSTDKS